VTTVAKEFDPYYEWLGIPPKDQPPNHYRLLGIELFESNRNVVDTAANRQMSFIKEYQAGAHSELSQKLLNEFSAARICLLSAAAKAAYDEQLRAKLKAQAAPVQAVPIPSSIRWRNGAAHPHASTDRSVPPSPLASAIPLPAPTGLDARPAPPISDATPSDVTGRWSGVGRQSRTRPSVLAVATAVVAIVTAVAAAILGFVVARSFGPEPPFYDNAVAHALDEQPGDIEESEAFVAATVTVSEPATFSPSSAPTPGPARTSEPVDSQLALSTTAVPTTSEATQSVSPPGRLIVDVPAEPVPAPMNRPVLVPVIEPLAELPTTTAPLPPPLVETLEQAEERLKTAAERASSPAEHREVAQESLSIVNRAIVDARAELGKRVAERALAAARKSESDDLVKQATLLWSELEQPLTDEVKERARQRLRREPAP